MSCFLSPSGRFGKLTLIVIAAGCSGADELRPVPASGMVTYNGEPVEGASVMFFSTSEAGSPATGKTNAAGEFTLTTLESDDGAYPGSHKVTINKSESKPYPFRPDNPGLPRDFNKPPVRHLPAKYADPQRSDLTATVTEEGPNTFEFKLVD